MNKIKKRAVVAVYEKTHVVEFMDGLSDLGYQLYATSGTASEYRDKTGKPVDLLPELTDQEFMVDDPDREITAQLTSGLMVARKAIQVACLNLRPSKEESDGSSDVTIVDPDLGGISMIIASGKSGALVVTSHDQYEETLEQLRRPEGVDPQFRRLLPVKSIWHTIEHLASATSSNK